MNFINEISKSKHSNKVRDTENGIIFATINITLESTLLSLNFPSNPYEQLSTSCTD